MLMCRWEGHRHQLLAFRKINTVYSPMKSTSRRKIVQMFSFIDSGKLLKDWLLRLDSNQQPSG